MKSFLIIGSLMISKLAFTQPALKLFVYSQVFTPGIVPQRDIPSENGGSRESKPAATTQYYIYVTGSPAGTVKPDQVWLNGTWHKVSKTTVVKTPVKTDIPVPKVLVPALRQQLIRIDYGNPLPAIKKPFPALAKMMAASEFIARVVWKGKFYYFPLKKITVLDPVHAF